MNIIYEEKATTPFMEVKVFDIFTHEGNFYMKLPELLCYRVVYTGGFVSNPDKEYREVKHNAVQLNKNSSEAYKFFNHFDKVKVVSADLVIKEY